MSEQQIKQLEAEEHAAWLAFRKADIEITMPLRDKWLALSKQVHKEKLRAEMLAEIKAE